VTSPDPRQPELDAEQRHLDTLYRRLDQLRVEGERALDRVRRAPTAGTPAARSERDAFAALHGRRLRQLRAVEDRLCFGRLDLRDGERRYIGRIGLSDEEHRQLLLDWRAPAAEPFYRATAVAPDGVVRRRHLSTTGRTVAAVEDEVLDLDAVEGEQLGRTVVGEGSLLLALDAARTGHMRDIVSTIQAEQDRVIRAPLAGVLVVQGGPGTGKTAVALHRAAYLLYAHRDRIASSGVLVVGPNARFLRYIDQVLPALGEADAAVLRTPGQLYPGVDAVADEDPEVAAVKGDLRMARVIARAVRERERLIPAPIPLRVDGNTVVLTPEDVRAAHDRARRTGKPHNVARVTFARHLLGTLAAQLAGTSKRDLHPDDRAALVDDLRASPDVRRELNWCWAPITPERLLRDLYAEPDRLAAAARELGERERQLLRRDRRGAWTPADVALLDEAAELLGEDDSHTVARAAAEAAERRAELEYARGVLRGSAAGGMVTAEQLVERYAAEPEARTVGDRATADRGWAFAHVVVDEAQELSAMQWRMLVRRCPTRSMTVVGDLAQTSALHGATSWAQVLRPHAGDRWRVEELTVNYRTPRELMTLASDVLRAGGVRVQPPRSPRPARWPPVIEQVDAAALPDATVAAVRRELEILAAGTVAVITARAARADLTAAVGAAPDPDPTRVSVLTVNEVKGLEFDSVVVVEPAAIVAESPRGLNGLYVALTRATQRLRVLHAGVLPAGFPAVPSVPREAALPTG